MRRITHFAKDRITFGVTQDGYGIHFWAEGLFGDTNLHGIGPRAFGGVEYHWPKRPAWERETSDGNPLCWITGRRCWHDGSSLQASEKYIPMFRACNENMNFDPLFQSLERQLLEIMSEANKQQDA